MQKKRRIISAILRSYYNLMNMIESSVNQYISVKMTFRKNPVKDMSF